MLKNRDIICFSMSDWNQEMVSNRYHMMMRFAKNNRVFFFEKSILPSEWRRWPKLFWSIRHKQNIYFISLPYAASSPQRQIIYRYYLQNLMNHFQIREPIFWFYDYRLDFLIDYFNPKLSCYHCTEDYAQSSRIHSKANVVLWVAATEKKLVQKTDLIFAVSEGLTRQHRQQNQNTYLVANAVDYDFYKISQESPRQFDRKPILGYFGNLSAKVDFQIIDFLAQKMPQALLLLAGPVVAQNPACERLKKRSNVKFLGKQSLEKLPGLLREFDVCLIPYIQEPWFVKVSQPLKLYEYMSSGKPIVSTPMDCLKKVKKLVYIASSPQEFYQQVQKALKEKNFRLRQKRIETAKKNTWDKRFLFINQKIEEFFNGKLSSAKESQSFLDYFRKRKPPRWLIDVNDFSKIKNPKIIKEAEKILKHDFTILSHRHKFGSKIDWSAQFDGSASWLKGHYEFLNRVIYQNNFQNPYYIGDIKLPWEFNKHLHFITLAEAYVQTCKEKYAQEFIWEISDWLQENPYEYNLAWTQNLIVSHRAIVWVIALGVFIQSPLMTEGLWKRIFDSLEQHSEYIKKHYEIAEKSSNHLLGNLVAQIILCSIFPEISDSKKKLGESLKILEKELEKQVYADGVQYEQSLSYHRVVLEFLLLMLVAAENSKVKVSQKIRRKIEKMAEFLMHMSQPNGFYQPISDADGARVFLLSNNVLDSRPYLAVAAAIFKRGDFKFASLNQLQDFGFFLKKKQKIAFEKIKIFRPKETSKVFQEGGYWVLRQNWTKETPWLFFDCGPISMGKNPPKEAIGSHGHSDTLNFGLALGQQPIFTDIGSYSYTTQLPCHHYFRSAFGHNVPIVDNKDQNELKSAPWTMLQKAVGQNTKYQFSKDFDYLKGEHFGYKNLDKSIILRREILFLKKQKALIIKDSFLGKGKHKIEELFHLYPGLKVFRKKDNLIINSSPQVSLKVFFEAEIKIIEGQRNPPQGWYALDYGFKIPASVISLKTKITTPQGLYFLLNWGREEIVLEDIQSIFQKFASKNEKNQPLNPKRH